MNLNNVIDSKTKVAPHEFQSIKFWDKLYFYGRCKHCYFPKGNHPISAWVKARPIGDTTPSYKKKAIA